MVLGTIISDGSVQIVGFAEDNNVRIIVHRQFVCAFSFFCTEYYFVAAAFWLLRWKTIGVLRAARTETEMDAFLLWVVSFVPG